METVNVIQGTMKMKTKLNIVKVYLFYFSFFSSFNYLNILKFIIECPKECTECKLWKDCEECKS